METHSISNTFLFLLLLGYVKVYFHLPNRQTEEGITQAHAKGKVVPSVPIIQQLTEE
ncbi:MAG TPA: hypothetical protein VN703_01025 [Candidatus Sulfopaludibacter sp.]|nr:hypothetical protein [Candidatus Sulfopaludibacter sp.]